MLLMPLICYAMRVRAYRDMLYILRHYLRAPIATLPFALFFAPIFTPYADAAIC